MRAHLKDPTSLVELGMEGEIVAPAGSICDMDLEWGVEPRWVAEEEVWEEEVEVMVVETLVLE